MNVMLKLISDALVLNYNLAFETSATHKLKNS